MIVAANAMLVNFSESDNLNFVKALSITLFSILTSLFRVRGFLVIVTSDKPSSRWVILSTSLRYWMESRVSFVMMTVSVS